MSWLIKHLYRFGEFDLDADQKLLLRQGKPLLLAPKVLETLLTLVQNGGRIIEKEELMKWLWPDTFVEESNLTYTIVQLRKRLSDDARHPRYIETIPKRGYRFIVDVEEVLSDMGIVSNELAQRIKTYHPIAEILGTFWSQLTSALLVRGLPSESHPIYSHDAKRSNQRKG